MVRIGWRLNLTRLAKHYWGKQIRQIGNIRSFQLLPTFLFSTLLSISHALAQNQPVDPVKVGTIIHNPPYVFENPTAGIDVDIIREAFGHAGMEVEIVHAHLSRIGVLLDAERIDAMTAYRSRSDQCELSEPYGYWHNSIIVRAGLTQEIKSFDDLAGLKVGLFPQAKTFFGLDLVRASASFGNETTVFTTPSALRMLSYDRLDAYVGDSWGLDYLFHQNSEEETVTPYRVAHAFEPTARHLCFTDGDLRIAFNKGLSALQESGKIAEITRRYRN